MLVIDIQAAEIRFDEILDRAEHGEEIVITRDGKPTAKLIPATKLGVPVLGYSEGE